MKRVLTTNVKPKLMAKVDPEENCEVRRTICEDRTWGAEKVA